jgi:hypothetical protein
MGQKAEERGEDRERGWGERSRKTEKEEWGRYSKVRRG